MKLLNQSIKYFSISLLIIISLWAVVFYFNMLSEIKSSVDEGLENYKRQIVYQAENDSTLLQQHTFEEGFFTIHEILQEKAMRFKDRYIDTMMYMQDADDEEPELEPVRMLTTAFEHEEKYYELSIINSMVEEDDLVKEMLWETIFLYVFLVVGIILLNNIVLRRLWKPFYDFLSQLKSYRLGNSKQLPRVETTTKEFNDLQQAVTTLLLHSIESYEHQKQFIGNASHELQTPLAIATNKLELLIEQGNLKEQDAGSISEVLEIIQRLVRLNKSLLLLTKIENKQFLDNQLISINEIAKQSCEDLEEMASFKQVTLSIVERAELKVEMDTSLAAIIVSNLLRNAVFHNHDHGSVEVVVSEQSIRIINTGHPFPLDAEKVFTRFYKSELEQGGSGLGLAIVKAICSMYGYSVVYAFEEQKHCFEIQFRS